MYQRARYKGLYGRGMGAISCLKTDTAGNCTLVRDTASDVTVDVQDGADVYRYTESGQLISGSGGQSFTDWLNANGRNVAIYGGGALLLLVFAKSMSR